MSKESTSKVVRSNLTSALSMGPEKTTATRRRRGVSEGRVAPSGPGDGGGCIERRGRGGVDGGDDGKATASLSSSTSGMHSDSRDS